MKAITKQELKQKQSRVNDLTVINTLPKEQFQKYKIEGSINIPQDQDDFVKRVSTTVKNNKDAEIVVYCASQECDSSTQAANKLNEAGFKNVFDYEGGAQDWNSSNSSMQRSAN